MKIARTIVLGNKGPDKNVLWAKPEGDFFKLYAFLNGSWRPNTESSVVTWDGIEFEFIQEIDNIEIK